MSANWNVGADSDLAAVAPVEKLKWQRSSQSAFCLPEVESQLTPGKQVMKSHRNIQNVLQFKGYQKAALQGESVKLNVKVVAMAFCASDPLGVNHLESHQTGGWKMRIQKEAQAPNLKLQQVDPVWFVVAGWVQISQPCFAGCSPNLTRVNQALTSHALQGLMGEGSPEYQGGRGAWKSISKWAAEAFSQIVNTNENGFSAALA